MRVAAPSRQLTRSHFLPNGVSFKDGLEEDEAVLIALWNNAAFQELLVETKIAHADLIQAGMLPNPEFGYFFGVPGKAFRYAIEFPLEVLFTRPLRIRSAERETDRVSHRVTQGSLDLIRDVRQAFADVTLAEGRLRIADESVQLRSRLADLAQRRLEAGDISAQEAATAKLDALQARQDRIRAAHEVPVAEERLRFLLAIPRSRSSLLVIPTPLNFRDDLDVEHLTATAVHCRPDVLAAEQGVVAAAERAKLARYSWLRFAGILDATSGQVTGHEFGPGFRVTVPIFNWNQGGIARAEAELDRAHRQKRTITNQVILEVRLAYQRYLQAVSELSYFEDHVQPENTAAMRRSELSFREGDTSYVMVLETSRRLLDGRIRAEQLNAEVRRTWSELERSVGCRLQDRPLQPRDIRPARARDGGRQ